MRVSVLSHAPVGVTGFPDALDGVLHSAGPVALGVVGVWVAAALAVAVRCGRTAPVGGGGPFRHGRAGRAAGTAARGRTRRWAGRVLPALGLAGVAGSTAPTAAAVLPAGHPAPATADLAAGPADGLPGARVPTDDRRGTAGDHPEPDAGAAVTDRRDRGPSLWPVGGEDPARTSTADRGPRVADRRSTVVVRRGDTLWDLARTDLRHRGLDSSDAEVVRAVTRWWHLNRDVVGADADLILPGQVLAVPSPGPTSQNS